MKKVGILTFHRALNYGAIFQAYALQETLNHLGVDSEIIDYRAPFNEQRFKRKSLQSIVVPRELYAILFQNSYQLYNRASFYNFYKRFRLSNPCYTHDQLQKICSQYDAIICGSDQVWNLACTENDTAYFLPFPLPNTVKCSYAASMGVSIVSEKYKDDYHKWLSDFHVISVREKTVVSQLEAFTGRTVYCDLDPTLLVTAMEWRKLASYDRCPEKPFLLLYLMSEDKKLLHFARELAKRRNLIIVYINDRLFRQRGFENYRGVTPEDWLGLFDRAEYIITNSFHGTAFSLNFQKEFHVRYIPRSPANSRIQCLLEQFELERYGTGVSSMLGFDRDSLEWKLREHRHCSEKHIKTFIIGGPYG